MKTQCGFIALIGRPNVGKSTLMNRLINQKISITSRRPQTTRHRVLGINTKDNKQFVYVDTPGIHTVEQHRVNQLMNKTAKRAIKDVDCVVFIVEALNWKAPDEHILSILTQLKPTTILVINKIDRVKQKSLLLPFIEDLKSKYPFQAIIPLSAKSGMQVDALEAFLAEQLPVSPFMYDESQITDRSSRFICAEILREKVFRFCGQELPYSTSVEVEAFEETDKLAKIHALIIVDKDSHKRMIIGEKGQKMKELASAARIDMQKLLGKRVFLQCWVKVKTGWVDNMQLLKQLGYDD